VQQQLGNTEPALAAYQQCHEILQQLAGADPNNAQAQRDLLVGYYKLGQVQEALHKPAAALSLYQKALAIAEVLAAQDTHNQQAQNDLAALRNLVEQSESKL
jgi:tetratricopeptide (TPR) repeat protein